MADHTLREQAEVALRVNDALLRTIYLHSIVSVTDRSGHIVEVNDRFCAISGYGRAELLGRTHRLVNSGQHDPAFWAVMWSSLAEGQPWRGEICNRSKDGSYYWVDSIIAPVLNREGLGDRYISIRTDVSEHRRSEASLREATVKAEQANLAKTEFLANMSHEIRTPMNAVIGLSYLLGQTSLDRQQSELLGKVKVASKSLLEVLNNVLDLSKIEAGELILERVAFSLPALLKDLGDMMAGHAEAKGITFEVEALPDDVPAALEGDVVRLNQILINLLTNAIKFTERGGVKLRVRLLATTSGRVTLGFAVGDTGIGIAPADQERLFAPFAQADASITRRFGGSGLGLSIVKRLVKLMSGEVALDSTPGVGSEFRVVLDLGLPSPEALIRLQMLPTLSGARALLGVRVLIVDDSDINLDVTQRILELEGATVFLAGNGQQAFEFLRASPTAVDVVLMDVQMPVLDGLDATRRIRHELDLADLKIFALTASALSSERQKATAAGMNDYIVKPFDPQALVSTILRRVRLPGERPGQAVVAPPPALGASSWAEIDGIDSIGVEARMSGDFDLFRKLLKRLLTEFGEIARPTHGEDPAALIAHSQRMHKLRGSAGLLGANKICELAGEAEAAVVAGDLERAADAATRINYRMGELRTVADAVFSAASGRDPKPAASVTDRLDREMDPRALADLIDLLRRQCLSATDRFAAMAPQLRDHLGVASYERIRERVDDLQFAEAADALRAA